MMKILIDVHIFGNLEENNVPPPSISMKYAFKLLVLNFEKE